jgi:hypothetical protein
VLTTAELRFIAESANTLGSSIYMKTTDQEKNAVLKEICVGGLVRCLLYAYLFVAVFVFSLLGMCTM